MIGRELRGSGVLRADSGDVALNCPDLLSFPGAEASA